MSPHATATTTTTSLSTSSSSPSSPSLPSTVPTSPSLNPHHHAPRQSRPHLHHHPDSQLHDLVCIGFGPASLAIAIALQDALSSSSLPAPRVRFLEKQPHFAWHSGMLLPDAKMQITFLKDLATLRDPTSPFTFLNYLHAKNRLVAFTNLGTFLPLRVEFEDYLRWCAEHFHDVVNYGQNVERVEIGSLNSATGEVEAFRVVSRDWRTGEERSLRTKNVVIAAGGRPKMPKCLPTAAAHPRIFHSSQYATHVPRLFPEGEGGGRRPRRVAVIGAGQSAAECWMDLPQRFPGCQAVLFIRGAALRPSDDSPFVNEIFNPNHVSTIFSHPPTTRAALLAQDKATNYGVVRIELLEKIYAQMYAYQLRPPPYNEEASWPLRIKTFREIVGVRDVLTREGEEGVEVVVRDISGKRLNVEGRCGKAETEEEGETEMETEHFDLLVVASGYIRDAHEEMLEPLRGLMPANSNLNSSATSEHGKVPKQKPKWSVQRDYSITFAEGKVQPDARIFLQGCNEETHGLSDSLLSILAVRGGEMVERIFGHRFGRACGKHEDEDEHDGFGYGGGEEVEEMLEMR